MTSPRAYLALLLLGACAAPPGEDPTIREVGQGIDNGVLTSAGSAFERSTVGVERLLPNGHAGFCTGTIIAPQLVVTASHCFEDHSRVKVRFYSGGMKLTNTITADRVIFPNGINADGDLCSPSSGCYDMNNRLADLAVLHLDAPVNNGHGPALLPAFGSDADTVIGRGVFQVGTGNHDGSIDPGTQMRLQTTTILDVDGTTASSDGRLWVSSDQTDGGDSGGPIYASTSSGLKIVGALSGSAFNGGAFAMRDEYTALRDHADWLQSMASTGTYVETHLLTYSRPTCGGALSFRDFNQITHEIYPGDLTPVSFDVYYPNDWSHAPEIGWTCNGAWDSAACPVGTNAARVYRLRNSSTFSVECRSHQWSW